MGTAFKSLGITPSDVEPVTIEFGEWLPDLLTVNNPGAVEALNVLPNELGYVPFKAIIQAVGLVLPAACKGAITLGTKPGDIRLYAATADHLYVRNGDTFDEKFSYGIPLTSYHYWQFIQFGDYVVALRPDIKPQVAGTDGSDNFTELGGDPPIAQCGARVGDFLVLGNLDDEPGPDAARQPQRIRWNGFNRIDLPWTTDVEVQSDYQDMPVEGGAVIGITGREFGTVFQEHSISRMTYVGLPSVFEIETAEENRGAICTNGIVDIGALVFFIAEDGFFVWNGTNTTPIGSNKVNRYFFTRLNYTERRRIVGAVDYANECIRWAFPVGAGTALTEQIIYSYKDGRWSHATITVEYLLASYFLPASLDDLHGNLDADYPLSFDDPSYQGGKGVFAAFDSTHNYGSFTGAALAATLDTAEASGPNGRRVFVNAARPLVDVATNVCTMQAAMRDQLIGEGIAYSAATTQEITGECPIGADARYMRFRVNIPAAAAWSHALGVEVWRKATGRR